MTRVLVTGAGGFIGGHLVRRLLDDGFTVRCVDIKELDEWWQAFDEAENLVGDLRDLGIARLACGGMDVVYDLAEDMGGIGFIERNVARCGASVRIGLNMLDAAVENKIKRFFYSSSACVYSRQKQAVSDISALRESDAWPADPEPGYGLAKLYIEELAAAYMQDYKLDVRVARFHNVFGPHGTYQGGKEKAPAAICRKVIEAVRYGYDSIEIWGDGEQTRSFMYIDDCVEGIRRIMDSDVRVPINLGTSEMVTINHLVELAESCAGVRLRRTYNPEAPQGVRGRNSDNVFIKQELGWEPTIRLQEGLRPTYYWIKESMGNA